MPQAIPYIFYAAVAASTYVAVSSAQSAAHSASTIGDLNARATLQHGEENAQAAQAQGESQAQIAERQATAQLQQAQTEALAIRRNNERVRGTQRVAFLKSGVTLSGSAQDVIYDSAIEGELEALNATYKGNVAYNQNQDEAAYARSQGATSARLYRSRAQTDSQLAAYEGGARAQAYRAESVGSFFRGVATAAGGPSFT
jgi:hypothetical protein